MGRQQENSALDFRTKTCCESQNIRYQSKHKLPELPQNVDKCRNKTGFVGTFSENVGTLKASIYAGFRILFRLFRLFRHKNEGVG